MYSDIDVNSYLTGKSTLDGDSEVEQRVFTVLGTVKRSRWKRYEFGCFLEQYLFKPVLSSVASDIKREIEDAFIDPYNGLDDLKLGPVTVIPEPQNQSYYVEFSATQGIRVVPIKLTLRRL